LVWNSLAWYLATTPDERLRNPQRSLELAKRVCEARGHADPSMLSTLAAAYAAAGDFDEALQWVERALELTPAKDADSRSKHERHRELYRARKPIVGDA
jgi:hypothetical protein